MLKNVVLPAPFGPIRLTIVPSGIAKSTSFTATRPPNSLRRPWMMRRSATSARRVVERGPVSRVVERLVVGAQLELALAARARDQALRSEEHDDDDDDPVDARGVERHVDVRAEVAVQP